MPSRMLAVLALPAACDSWHLRSRAVLQRSCIDGDAGYWLTDRLPVDHRNASVKRPCWVAVWRPLSTRLGAPTGSSALEPLATRDHKHPERVAVRGEAHASSEPKGKRHTQGAVVS